MATSHENARAATMLVYACYCTESVSPITFTSAKAEFVKYEDKSLNACKYNGAPSVAARSAAYYLYLQNLINKS